MLATCSGCLLAGACDRPDLQVAGGRLPHPYFTPEITPPFFCLHLASSLFSSSSPTTPHTHTHTHILICFPARDSRLIFVYLLTATPGDIPLGALCNLKPRGHYRLVIPAATSTFKVDPVGSVGLSLTTEEVTTKAKTADMLKQRSSRLTSVGARSFVLFDTDLKRGWLVGGDTVALHLLRVHLKLDPDTRNFDFSSFNLLGNGNLSANSVLQNFNSKKESLNELQAMKDKPEKPDDKQPAETREEAVKRVIGEILDGIYAALLQVAEDAATLNDRSGISGQVQMWYEKKWGSTLVGWDFHNLAGAGQAQIYIHKMHKDPGWLPLTRQLQAAFLFANGLGEIFEPRAGSCCPYFPTLPIGNNFLASDMEYMERLITKYGGVEENNPPDRTVARLSRSQGWERRLNPFSRPNCQGDHLSALGPSCFPVQGTQHAPYEDDLWKRAKRDAKLIKDNNLYTKGEIQAMIRNHPQGVVVFGHQPDSEELKEIYRRNQQYTQSKKQRVANAASTAARLPSRPSSRGSTQRSTGIAAPSGGSTSVTHSSGVAATRSSSTASSSQSRTVSPNLQSGQQQRTPSMSSARSAASASETTGAVKSRTGQLPATSAQRTPSMSSVRSTASSTQPTAPSAGPSAGRPQLSTPQASVASAHRAASNASMRSNDSRTRPNATHSATVQSHMSPAQASMQIATRVSSNSSVRTTGSVATKPQGSSQPQAPAGQPSAASLKKTNTNFSDTTTSSRSSGGTHNSTASASAANNRQRQHRIEQQLGATTAAAGSLAPGQPTSSSHWPSGTTENPHSTSSGPDPTGGRGSDT